MHPACFRDGHHEGRGNQAPQISVGVGGAKSLGAGGLGCLFAEHSQGCSAQALVLGHLIPGAGV